jgi:DNA repair protein RadC
METKETPHAKHRERMINKFIQNPDSFAEHELLEVLLYSVIKRQDTNALAHRILSYFKNLKAVFDADVNTLMKINGVGIKVATHIKTVGLIMGKIYNSKQVDAPALKSFDKIKSLVISHFENESTEKYMVFYLNNQSKVISVSEHTSSQRDKVTIDTTKIIDAISILKPAQMIIAHNHISGSATPSGADDNTTTKLVMLLNLHNVSLLDHIIISKGNTYSYFAEGRLQHIQKIANIDNILKKSIMEDNYES